MCEGFFKEGACAGWESPETPPGAVPWAAARSFPCWKGRMRGCSPIFVWCHLGALGHSSGAPLGYGGRPLGLVEELGAPAEFFKSQLKVFQRLHSYSGS